MSALSFQRTRQYPGLPPFVVDQHAVVRDNGRQIDWDLLGDTFVNNPQTVQINGAATAAATSITVDPLPIDLKIGDLLDFEANEVVAVVDAATPAGSTTITVEALASNIPDNAQAVVQQAIDGELARGGHVKAGTIVDLTSTGKIVPSSLGTAGATAYGILATNADEYSDTDAASGYGVLVSASIYENLLPDSANAGLATWKTELLARGGFWLFQTYADNT